MVGARRQIRETLNEPDYELYSPSAQYNERPNHGAMDAAIPIVFPDYLITVETPKEISLPDLPWIDIGPSKINIPAYKDKLRDLGHAGILIISGRSGVTKYYEYGRYDRLGRVKKRDIANVKIVTNGRPSKKTLTTTMVQISSIAGQRGRISGAYIEVDDKYTPMLEYAVDRETRNNDPSRPSYDILTNSCLHFMKNVLNAGGVGLPLMLDPRPVSYIEELRASFPKLDYDPDKKVLTVEGVELL